MTPESDEQYRALVEQSPTMIWRAGLDGRCEYVNATWRAFTGQSPPEQPGDARTAHIHPDDLPAVLASDREHFARREAFAVEYRLRRHDGVYRYVADRGAPYLHADGSWAGFVGACVDVDDRRYDDAASDLGGFFTMSLDHLCVAGLDGYFKRLNPSWTRTLGWSTEELLARPSIDLVHPDDRAVTMAARGRLREGEVILALTNRYRCKDGSYRWFEWRSIALLDRGLVYAAARDITGQREAQRTHRSLTESLTTTLNSIADGVIATDADSAVMRMNPVAERLTGWTSDEARGRPLAEVFRVVVADTRAPATWPVERALRGGIAVEVTSPTLLVGRGGTELPVASSVAPMRDGDGSVSGAVIVFRDRTVETKAREVHEHLQRQLILADRMASVGTLAAGVAHEINNPLAYVIANLDMLAEEIRTPSPETAVQRAEWAEMADEAVRGAERIKKIVRGLKTFSRAEEERRTVLDVHPVLELAINMAFNEIRHRARLVRDYGETPPVEADDARLGQVFINLLVNAAQALPEGATDAHEIRVVTSTDAGGRAVIEVQDTGAGIPPSVLDRVFDPFFTTKPIGVGTGLGLSICHSIVTGMDGEITARNRPSRGATFRVVLPAATRRHRESGPPSLPGVAPVARRAAVLVVDDERAVGITLGRVLRDHAVTVVTTAREALDLLLADTPFDVVLSDLMMPGMSGMELHDELARRRPQAAERMVFITGGAFTPAAKAFLARIPNEHLEKPFDAATVRALVERFVG